jgi:hypothetical protein
VVWGGSSGLEWKSLTALHWKESWGASVLDGSFSFAVRLSAQIGRVGDFGLGTAT